MKTEYHRLLSRQIRRHLNQHGPSDPLSPEIERLLEAISQTYETNDTERRFLEHTISVNSEELNSANASIREKNESLRELLEERSKLLESRTEENEEMLHLLHQYRSAMDQSLIVSITDTKGIITYVNDNFCLISGYVREELIGQPHNIVRHPQSDRTLFAQLWKTIQSKQIWKGVIANRKKNGEKYYVRATILPLLDKNGRILEYMALREDITSQIIYQEQLQLQQERISSIFNTQENIVLIVDEVLGIVDANRRFFETFGFDSIDTYRGAHCSFGELFVKKEGFLYPLETQNEAEWFNALSEQLPLNPMLCRESGDTEQIIKLHITPIILEHRPHHLVTLVDVTELETARAKAQIAEQAKSQFLATMSHEIRTPMNGISGFVQLLGHTRLDEKQKRYIELIGRSMESLMQIINDVLDFSKIESGQLELELLPCNLFTEIESAFLLLSEKAREHRIHYAFHIDERIAECVVIDVLHLKQVLINLLSNAIKFTPDEGHVALHVTLESTNSTHEELLFSVVDSGIGIPKERQEKIFQPFAQADSSTTRRFGGTGLGLSISTSLVAHMGGTLKVRSQEHHGSTFYFALEAERCTQKPTLKEHLQRCRVTLIESPTFSNLNNVASLLEHFGVAFERIAVSDLAQIPDDSDVLLITSERSILKPYTLARCILMDTKAQEEDANDHLFIINRFESCPSTLYNTLLRLNLIQTPPSQPTTIDSVSLDILVAEDYEINRMLIEELLGGYSGIRVTFAHDGFEAVEAALARPYDLILMDINMPNLGGIEATARIRAHLGDALPIVALTANALEGDRERFLAAGMNDYLSKPLSFEEFDASFAPMPKRLNQPHRPLR